MNNDQTPPPLPIEKVWIRGSKKKTSCWGVGGIIIAILIFLFIVFVLLANAGSKISASFTPTPTKAPSEYKTIDPRELETYPDNHKNEFVTFSGTVFHIIDDQQFQIYNGSSDNPVIIETTDHFTGLYENDYIKVYGMIEGKECTENVFNAQICQPLLIDARFVK